MSLQEKLEEEKQLSEVLSETKELNRLMTSYIRVQMNEETAKDMTIDSQLNRIRKNSDQIMSNMNSILEKQSELLERGNNTFQRVLTDGQKKMQQTSNETIQKLNEIEKSNSSQLKSMNEELNMSMGRIQTHARNVVNEAKEESKDLVSKAKKGAMAAYWGDAFKYGLATSIIVAPVVLLVDWLAL